MSLTWEAPRKSRIYQIDDSPQWHSEGWGERSTYRKQGFRYWAGVAIVGGLLAGFWILAVRCL